MGMFISLMLTMIPAIVISAFLLGILSSICTKLYELSLRMMIASVSLKQVNRWNQIAKFIYFTFGSQIEIANLKRIERESIFQNVVKNLSNEATKQETN